VKKIFRIGPESFHRKCIYHAGPAEFSREEEKEVRNEPLLAQTDPPTDPAFFGKEPLRFFKGRRRLPVWEAASPAVSSVTTACFRALAGQGGPQEMGLSRGPVKGPLQGLLKGLQGGDFLVTFW